MSDLDVTTLPKFLNRSRKMKKCSSKAPMKPRPKTRPKMQGKRKGKG